MESGCESIWFLALERICAQQEEILRTEDPTTAARQKKDKEFLESISKSPHDLFLSTVNDKRFLISDALDLSILIFALFIQYVYMNLCVYTYIYWWDELALWKRPWCWERLRAGGQGDDRGLDGWMASQTQWIWVWVTQGVGYGQGGLACCVVHGVVKSQKWLSIWTELNS